MREVAIVGAGMTRFGELWQSSSAGPVRRGGAGGA